MPVNSGALKHVPPLTVRPDLRIIDLIFILDTICPEDAFNERRKFIRSVVQETATRLQPGGRLRVAVIPYGPHERITFEAQAGSIQVPAPTAKLTDNLAAIYRFLKDQSAQSSRGFEGAYEEALYALYSLDWEPTSYRVLVTVGHRPPRPSKPWLTRSKDPFDCFYQESCEQDLDWRLLLTGMRSMLRIHSIAVICASEWIVDSKLKYAERYSAFCWKEIGYTMSQSFNPTLAAVRKLADDILLMV